MITDMLIVLFHFLFKSIFVISNSIVFHNQNIFFRNHCLNLLLFFILNLFFVGCGDPNNNEHIYNIKFANFVNSTDWKHGYKFIFSITNLTESQYDKINHLHSSLIKNIDLTEHEDDITSNNHENYKQILKQKIYSFFKEKNINVSYDQIYVDIVLLPKSK